MANDYWLYTAYANTDRACYLEARPQSGLVWKPYKQVRCPPAQEVGEAVFSE